MLTGKMFSIHRLDPYNAWDYFSATFNDIVVLKCIPLEVPRPKKNICIATEHTRPSVSKVRNANFGTDIWELNPHPLIILTVKLETPFVV